MLMLGSVGLNAVTIVVILSFVLKKRRKRGEERPKEQNI